MMEAQIKALSGRVTIKVQGEDAKALFRELSSAMEVFSADDTCGICGSSDLRYNVRTVDSYVFYELRCVCSASLPFGVRKDGSGLFPKRSGEGTERGWSRYEHVEG